MMKTIKLATSEGAREVSAHTFKKSIDGTSFEFAYHHDDGQYRVTDVRSGRKVATFERGQIDAATDGALGAAKRAIQARIDKYGAYRVALVLNNAPSVADTPVYTVAEIPELPAHVGSWMVADKNDGSVIEVFKDDRNTLTALPADRYIIKDAHTYLAGLNKA